MAKLKDCRKCGATAYKFSSEIYDPMEGEYLTEVTVGCQKCDEILSKRRIPHLKSRKQIDEEITKMLENMEEKWNKRETEE